MPPASSADVVVLGAGPAGLTAAWRAARSGRSVVLLERSEVVGGMAASFEVAGVRVDLGSHRLHASTDPEVMADLRRLLGEDLQTRDRNGRVRVQGCWVGFPLRAGELARSLPAGFVTSAARDAALSPFRRRGTGRHSQDGASYASVLRASLGPTAYDALYGPFAQKLWGLPGDRIDAEQVRARVADTPWKVAGRFVLSGRSSRDSAAPGRTYHYPRRGFGQIPEALAQAAVDAGAEVRTGAEVLAVHGRPDGVRVETAAGVLHARQAFSTVPLTSLARLGRPAPSVQVVQDAAGLTYRATVLVYLVHEGGRWTGHDAHYVPDATTLVARISEPANYRDSADDPVDRSVVCAEIPCAVGDAVWTSTDEDLARLVEVGLERLGLPPVSRPADGGVVVRRLPRVYPVWARGYADRLAGLDAWAGRLANVTTFGRLGLFVHDSTHQSIRMAYDAVAALRPDGSQDLDAWARSREAFRAHVAEE